MATGQLMGPDAANPTKTATSMRGRESTSGGDCASKRRPGKRRMLVTIADISVAVSLCEKSPLLHLQTLISERQLFHRHIGTFGVERSTGVLDDARAQQFPGGHYRAVIFVL